MIINETTAHISTLRCDTDMDTDTQEIERMRDDEQRMVLLMMDDGFVDGSGLTQTIMSVCQHTVLQTTVMHLLERNNLKYYKIIISSR